jgi:urease accessory protein
VTRLTVLQGAVPLLPRRTVAAGPGATVHLVGGAAGPLGGDDLRLDVEVGAGADLCIRTVAATIVLPGTGPSRLVVHAGVAAGARLRWLPEPLVSVAGSSHDTVTRLDVADGGVAVWREELVCGRYGEPPGAVRLDTTVRYAGRTLYRHRLAVGAPGWDSPAVLGTARATGTLLLVNDLPATVPPATPGCAALPLAGPGLLFTAVADDPRAVRTALDSVS